MKSLTNLIFAVAIIILVLGFNGRSPAGRLLVPDEMAIAYGGDKEMIGGCCEPNSACNLVRNGA
jgi:hypothetical protein